MEWVVLPWAFATHRLAAMENCSFIDSSSMKTREVARTLLSLNLHCSSEDLSNRCTGALAQQRINQDDKDKLSKFFNHQRNRLADHSFACIPDQGNLEDINWLMKEKEIFYIQVCQMKAEYDTFMNDTKSKKAKRLSLLQTRELEALVKKWYDAFKIDVSMLPDNQSGNITLPSIVHEIDFRPFKKIYDANNEALSKWTPHMSETAKRMWKNAEKVLPLSEKNPIMDNCEDLIVSEMALLAWGTHPQPVHTDFALVVTNENGKTDDETIRAPPPAKPDKWYGSMLYRFLEDGEAGAKAPTIGWMPKDCSRKRMFNVEPLEGGYVMLVGPDFEHCGGVSHFPHVRLRVQFERKSLSRQSKKNNVFPSLRSQEEISFNAKRMRKRRLAKGESNPNKRRYHKTSLALCGFAPKAPFFN